MPVITTASGLQYEDTTVGEGAEATKGNNVSVHYTGWLYNNGEQGAKFDSKLDSIGQSISLLVRIDERQVAIAERLQLGAATMQKHEERLSSIEAAMPGLKEMRTYVVAGVVAGAGMIGAALLKLVVFT